MNCAKSTAQTFIGLDVHKKEIVAGLLLPDDRILPNKFQNRARGITKLVKWMNRYAEGDFECCYEAGFCGYDPANVLTRLGVVCHVVAPSMIPVKRGDRVKNDRRDAEKLARYLRAGLLHKITVPSESDEALRDLCRNREDARKDLHAARQRLIKFLDRKGYFYAEGGTWTVKHWAWIRSISFKEELMQLAYQDCVFQVEHQESRLKQLDGLLNQIAHSEPYCGVVGLLWCFRGIDWLSAIILVSELYDPVRFQSANALMAYIGLTPSEESSGEKERRGGLTGGGNRIVRRILVETAWHQRRKPHVSKALEQRRQGQPPEVIAYADRAMDRLSKRYFALIYKQKHPNVAIVAVARELAGFIWGVLCSGQYVTKEGSCERSKRAA